MKKEKIKEVAFPVFFLECFFSFFFKVAPSVTSDVEIRYEPGIKNLALIVYTQGIGNNLFHCNK